MKKVLETKTITFEEFIKEMTGVRDLSELPGMDKKTIASIRNTKKRIRAVRVR